MAEESTAPIRFSDILTTASAVADYLGEADVRAIHLLDAVAILLNEKTIDELGRPLSPLVRRSPRPGASDAVKGLVQRWFEELGSDAHAELDADMLRRFREEASAAEEH